MTHEFSDLETLIDDFAAPMATSNGNQHERAKAELAAKLTNSICETLNALDTSINNSAKSSDNLAKKVFWLNVILTIATVAIAINC